MGFQAWEVIGYGQHQEICLFSTLGSSISCAGSGFRQTVFLGSCLLLLLAF